MPNGHRLTLFQRIEFGAIATLVVALLGFAFWLGGLHREVAKLSTIVTPRREFDLHRDHVDKLLEDLKEELYELRASTRAFTSRWSQAVFVGPRVIERNPLAPIEPGTSPQAEGGSLDVGRHYHASGLMGDIDDITISKSDEGEWASQFRYETTGEGDHEWDWKYIDGVKSNRPAKFAGVMWLHPPNAWGDDPKCGHDLRRFRGRVSWEARSLKDPVKVEFLMGGVIWNWRQDETGKWSRSPAPYGDSMPWISLGVHNLTEDWQALDVTLYELPEEYFLRVVGAFGWTVSWSNNGVETNVQGDGPTEVREFVFEVRNIQYHGE